MNVFSQMKSNSLLPLTHPQKRVWYIEKVHPNTSINNIGGTVRVYGEVDFSLLGESINIFVKNNDALRIRLTERDEDVYQYISDYEKQTLDFYDFSKCEEPELEFEKWINSEAEKPFVLENQQLHYFALYKVSEKFCGYLAKFHHIIADGWSIKIMTEEICNSYARLIKDEVTIEGKEDSYTEYINQEEKYLLSDKFLKNKAFWNGKFEMLPEEFLLNTSNSICGKRKAFVLSYELSQKIKEFVMQKKCSLNTFFVTLYLLYLNKVNQQEDIIIGTPVLNRSGKKEKNIFGMFTSTMPFRFFIDDNDTVQETLAKVNSELLSCYFNQKYPYDVLFQDLELKKKGINNLFNVCVNYYNTKLNNELNGNSLENVEFYNGNQIYSLQLIFRDWSAAGNLTLDIDYKISDYSDKNIEDMYYRLIHLANQMLDKCSEKNKLISILTGDEIEKVLYRFNATYHDYPRDKSIVQLFEEQAEKKPNRIAVTFDDRSISYEQLREKADKLAKYLLGKGLKNETIVGLYSTHSIEMIIAILGILKAGGAYLPLDPNYPDERLNLIIQDSHIKFMLINCELNNGIIFEGEVIDINKPEIYEYDATGLETQSNPENLAYIIYTSGSTGRPKGVMIEHRGLTNYVYWANRMYLKGEDEVFALHTSIAFDLTVTSIFTPLISGGKIIIYRGCDNDEEYILYRIIKENKATVVKLTPSHLALIENIDLSKSSIRTIVAGGEVLKTTLARKIYENFNGNVDIFNEYGPTEAVVGCMIHKYDYHNDTGISVPIGIPAHNVQLYVLDKKMNPVTTNQTGELYISGDGIARGYLNNSSLTAEKFIKNPFMQGARMYRTGDIVRFLDTGKLEYIGRIDEQVKIRGHRIELGEIEKLLLEIEQINDAVLKACKDDNGDAFLCAYIVMKSNLLDIDIKNHLADFLPDYMIPQYFIRMNELPLSQNGKIDKNRLPVINTAKPVDEAVTFRNDKEEVLGKAVCDVLKLKSVSMKQNFYHLGGDSIKAIQISSRLNSWGYKIKVKNILSNPVIEDMALYIEKTQIMAAEQDTCEGQIEAAPIVSWFLSQDYVNPSDYHQHVLLNLVSDIQISNLEKVFDKIILHHDSLRINYNPSTKKLFYNNSHLQRSFKIAIYDMTDTPYTDQTTAIENRVNNYFDIEKDLLLKVYVFDFGKSGRRLYISAHHLVIDGVSWKIILSDLNSLILQSMMGHQLELPQKTHSYQKWTEILNKYKSNIEVDELKYWQCTICSNLEPELNDRAVKGRNKNPLTVSMQLSQEYTEKLLLKANYSHNTEVKDLLLTSLLKTIRDYEVGEIITVDVEGHGREDMSEEIDVSRTVGWFTSIYPFMIKFDDDNLSRMILKTKEELRGIPNNGVGFGILKYLQKSIQDSTNRSVRFNYLGDFSAESTEANIELLSGGWSNSLNRNDGPAYLVDVNCFIIGTILHFKIALANDCLQQSGLFDGFPSKYINNLTYIIDYCCSKDTKEFSPSDFDMVNISQQEIESLFR
ncbi:MAG: amino acid adenylation domain-containing protein [Bacillota bacterium]